MDINSITYSTGKLNAFEQLHVSRRLAPMLAALVSSFQSAPSLAKGAELNEDDILALATGPLADTFSKMSDEDVNYIVNTCLAVCQRKQAGGYSKVISNGNLMFSDIELDTLMGLTLAVIQENLGRFFPTSQPTSDAPK
jgi:hypothetical protein